MEVQEASEALGHRLTDTGERSFVQQLRNIQEALQRPQPSFPDRERPSAPGFSPSPGEPSPVAGDGPSDAPVSSSVQSTHGQEEPVLHSPAGGLERKRRFLPEGLVPGSPEPPGSHEVSITPAGQPRSPPSVPQSDSRDDSPHHSRVPQEEKGRKRSHQELLRKLKQEHEEELKGRKRDDDHERQK